VLTLLVPRLMKLIYRVAMFVATGISWVMTRVVLFILFYLVISPLSVVMRILGKDFLGEKIDATSKTYWVKRGPRPPRAQYEKLY